MLESIDTSMVDWSRAQFALTAMYHWLFVPLTLGLAVIMGLMDTLYYVSGNEWSGNTEGKLLANMLGENEKFTPGKQYDEAISVTNSGDIDTFVRVIITKSWKDKEGRKNAELSPDLIELNVPENSARHIGTDHLRA